MAENSGKGQLCLYSQTACFGGCDTITELPQDRKDELKKFYELHKLY